MCTSQLRRSFGCHQQLEPTIDYSRRRARKRDLSNRWIRLVCDTSPHLCSTGITRKFGRTSTKSNGIICSAFFRAPKMAEHLFHLGESANNKFQSTLKQKTFSSSAITLKSSPEIIRSCNIVYQYIVHTKIVQAQSNVD